MEKKCSKCNTVKPFDCFSKGLDANGLHYWCKECVKEHGKINRLNNLEKRKEYTIKYRKENRETMNAKAKQFYRNNIEKEKARHRKYYQENKEKILTKEKFNPKRKQYRYEYRRRPEVVARTNKRFKERYHSEPHFRMRDNLSGRMNHLLKGRSKSAPTMKLIGCSLEELKIHIESQFQKGMTWENHNKNGWHIDHIIPCNQFDLDCPEEQKKCFNYKNLRPLWAEENLSTQWR